MDQASGDHEIETQRRKLLRTYSRMARLARTGGLTPGTPDHDLAVGPPIPTVTPAVWNARRAQRLSPGYWRALRSESAASNTTSSDQVDAARKALGNTPLGDMLLIVLTAGQNALPRGEETAAAAEARHAMWRGMHDEIAALSSRGERRTVEAGHGIQMEKPQVVISAIEEVLALARSR